MNPDHRLGFSVNGDNALETIKAIFRFLAELLHPVRIFINSVSDAGWLGFAFVFMMFFMFYLVKMSLKSGKPVVFGEILQYIGSRGLLFCGVYLAVLIVEYLIMPPIALLVTAIFNSITGGEPGLFTAIGFLLHASPARTEFMHDLVAFYGASHSMLPLGVRAFGLVTVAILAIWIVGRALASLQREVAD